MPEMMLKYFGVILLVLPAMAITMMTEDEVKNLKIQDKFDYKGRYGTFCSTQIDKLEENTLYFRYTEYGEETNVHLKIDDSLELWRFARHGSTEGDLHKYNSVLDDFDPIHNDEVKVRFRWPSSYAWVETGSFSFQKELDKEHLEKDGWSKWISVAVDERIGKNQVKVYDIIRKDDVWIKYFWTVYMTPEEIQPEDLPYEHYTKFLQIPVPEQTKEQKIRALQEKPYSLKKEETEKLRHDPVVNWLEIPEEIYQYWGRSVGKIIGKCWSSPQTDREIELVEMVKSRINQHLAKTLTSVTCEDLLRTGARLDQIHSWVLAKFNASTMMASARIIERQKRDEHRKSVINNPLNPYDASEQPPKKKAFIMSLSYKFNKIVGEKHKILGAEREHIRIRNYLIRLGYWCENITEITDFEKGESCTPSSIKQRLAAGLDIFFSDIVPGDQVCMYINCHAIPVVLENGKVVPDEDIGEELIKQIEKDADQSSYDEDTGLPITVLELGSTYFDLGAYMRAVKLRGVKIVTFLSMCYAEKTLGLKHRIYPGPIVTSPNRHDLDGLRIEIAACERNKTCFGYYFLAQLLNEKSTVAENVIHGKPISRNSELSCLDYIERADSRVNGSAWRVKDQNMVITSNRSDFDFRALTLSELLTIPVFDFERDQSSSNVTSFELKPEFAVFRPRSNAVCKPPPDFIQSKKRRRLSSRLAPEPEK